MNDKIKDKGRLSIALDMFDGRQWQEYAKLVDKKELSTVARLSIAANLFTDKQADEFTRRVARHEGFINIPKNCPGTDCCGCTHTRCPHFRRS